MQSRHAPSGQPAGPSLTAHNLPPAPPRPAAAVPPHHTPPASRAQPHIAQAALPRPPRPLPARGGVNRHPPHVGRKTDRPSPVRVRRCGLTRTDGPKRLLSMSGPDPGTPSSAPGPASRAPTRHDPARPDVAGRRARSRQGTGGGRAVTAGREHPRLRPGRTGPGPGAQHNARPGTRNAGARQAGREAAARTGRTGGRLGGVGF